MYFLRNKKPQYLEKVDDLNRIRLSRFKLERWLYLPFFLRIIKGCFVRVGVAVPPGQRSQYKIYEIDGLDTQQKPYELGSTKTNKVLLLKLPGDEKGRKFRFEFVSNQACTEAEFQHWKLRMEQHQVEFPTHQDIENKEKDIKEAMEYQLEEGDIEAVHFVLVFCVAFFCDSINESFFCFYRLLMKKLNLKVVQSISLPGKLN